MEMTRPINGKDVLYGFIAFFMLIFAANGALVYFAMESWTGLETDNSYEKGLAYNRILDADARQQALGWQGIVGVDPVSNGRVRLRVTVSDRQGRSLSGLDVVVRFVRPTHHGHDFTETLKAKEAGIYETEFQPPLRGIWDVRVDAAGSSDSFVFQDRVVLK